MECLIMRELMLLRYLVWVGGEEARKTGDGADFEAKTASDNANALEFFFLVAVEAPGGRAGGQGVMVSCLGWVSVAALRARIWVGAVARLID